MSGSGGARSARDLSGSRLGQYELLAFIGGGGMGEVYRARDPRLAREVALKILPAELSSQADRLRRFEREARAASALNHPNIVTVYDIGQADSTSYIAMELVAGRTLREVLPSGALTVRKTLDIAVQIANGLARAHEAGIVHRDVKPENVMVSADGLVKILDFGLTKWVRTPVDGGAEADVPTMSMGTEPGILLGTVGYMSPEQAAGRKVDFRSDQFSFGALLYEMATGKRAFQKDAAVDTLSAILHEEPKPVGELSPATPAPLRWIVERCLAKDPKDRYASTADLARDLATMREHLSEYSGSGSLSASSPGSRRPPLWKFAAFAAITVAIAAALLVGERLGRRRTSSPKFRQLTFRSAGISTARFTPDGETVVYSAQWEGKRPELFETRLDHAESRPLGLPAAQVLSISRSGYMAVLLLPSFAVTLRTPHSDSVERFPLLLFGTLAQVPLVGGAPRELLEGVSDADWAPNGKDLAVVRFADGKNRLEFPIGRLLYERTGWLNFPRVSPRGDHVSFADAGANLLVSDLAGHVKRTGISAWEQAWQPVTGELWHLGGTSGTTELRAMSVRGKDRLVTTLAGDFTLYDISPNGRVLLGQVTGSEEIFASVPGEARDRPLFEDASVEDVSSAGDMLTFTRRGFFDEQPTAYLGKADGSPAKRLGALGGYAGARLSPDGKFVLGANSPDGLIVLDPEKASLLVVPTGVGQPLSISTRGISAPFALGFSSDGKRIYFLGAESGHRERVWVQGLADGNRHPLSPEGTRRGCCLSSDGRFIVAVDSKGDWNLYPTMEGETRRVAGLSPGEEPVQWTADGRWLYVRGADELRSGESLIAARVYRLDPWTGRRELWKEIPPISPTTGGGIGKIVFAADGKRCFYNHHRYSSELFVADGLK